MSSICSPQTKPLSFAGAGMVADPSGALWWPDERSLLVADLHLEKGSSFARRGVFLPPYDTRTTLARLAVVIARWQPRRVIALGDSFHDPQALDRIGIDDRESLKIMTGEREWIWLSGNHEAPTVTRQQLSTLEASTLMPMATGITIGGIALRHESVACDEPEISGHYHPKATVKVHGRRLTCRCFVTDGRTMIMPAFGSYTGGLDVGANVVRQRFPTGFLALLLGRDGVRVFPSSMLTRSGEAA